MKFCKIFPGKFSEKNPYINSQGYLWTSEGINITLVSRWTFSETPEEYSRKIPGENPKTKSLGIFGEVFIEIYRNAFCKEESSPEFILEKIG